MKDAKTDWNKLYESAESAETQGGYFTLAQANAANFSSQAINKHLGKRMERVRRGIYRLGHYPKHTFEEGLTVYSNNDLPTSRLNFSGRLIDFPK